jgi:hypothetical protein
MKRLFLTTVAVSILANLETSAFAIDPSAVMGLTPDQVQQQIQNEQESNRLMLELIKERNRQQQYTDQNPYAGCLSLGEVRGKDIEEAKALGRQLGGTNIQYVKTTSSYVRAKIYKCRQ